VDLTGPEQEIDSLALKVSGRGSPTGINALGTSLGHWIVKLQPGSIPGRSTINFFKEVIMKKMTRIDFFNLFKEWYELDRAIDEIDVGAEDENLDYTPTPEERKKLESSVSPYDPVRAGEIRLLSKKLTPNVDRPVYVAIIEEGEGLTAYPFSAYPVPATQGELLLPGRDKKLSVVQAWNPFWLSEPEDLNAGWHVDDLSEDEAEAIRQVNSFVMMGVKLPLELELRTGLPIISEDDPRLAYQEEEMAVWGHLKRKISGD